MLKHYEDIRDRDALSEHPETIEQLPELPEGVRIPDDLSGLGVGERPRRSVRWLGWAAALALVVGGSVFIATQLGEDTPVETPERQLTMSDYLPDTSGQVYNYNPTTPPLTMSDYLPDTSGQVYNYNPTAQG